MPTDAPAKDYPFSFLVVDDEAFIRTLLVRQLRQLGATGIATASNGVDALAHLDAADPKPDVLLVDLAMPEMGGVEFLRRLADRAYKGAVVLVSGADPETLIVAEEMAKYRDIAILGFVRKPVKHEALAQVLDKLD